MPNAISTEYLNTLRTNLENNPTLEQVLTTYAQLRSEGYQYAGWAYGVASGEYITGRAAVDFLQSTALLGMGGKECSNLPQSVLNQVKIDMALGYLDTLILKSKDTDDVLYQDVKFEETRNFHAFAFQKNGLSIENWTLEAPFQIIVSLKGADYAEELWVQLRDTGGDGLDALSASIKINNIVGSQLMSDDPVIKQLAEQWFDIAPGTANFDQLGKTIAIISDEDFSHTTFLLNPTIGIIFSSAVTVLRRDPLTLDLDGDGIETVGISSTSPILFDATGDGIKTATGWIKADDGLLVLDRNGNRTIDSGLELFGDSTRMSNGQLATNGSEALAEVKSNQYGKLVAIKQY